MRENLIKIREKVEEEISSAKILNDIENIRVKYLGKKGNLTLLLKDMGKLSKEERPIIGKLANEIRESIEKAIESGKERIKEKELEIRLIRENIDVSENHDRFVIGHRHPLNKTIEDLESFFQTMGFSIVDGPEIETVENNFDKLNAPKNHPSRDLSDTFYISEKILLRTQTSPVQIRTMMNQKPPIKMISPGRTFRFDDVDDTHSPMFHQIEGLVVDKNITMANLIHTLDTFIREFFGKDIKTRYRPHYFPFTEPSAEVDVLCFNCHGKGCSECNNTGWSMELLGCGMVHPNVLRVCGIDPEIYSGFAFGMGIDRITMLRHKINNIRLLYDNDKRFLEQF